MDTALKQLTYAGIGSRIAPPDILGLCVKIARHLRGDGWVLRSGHAIGCDQEFEAGAGRHSEIFLPWKDYEDQMLVQGKVRRVPSLEAMQMVEQFHPNPSALSMSALRLHGRNCHIILGDDLNSPVDRVVCWTLKENRGGTSFGIRLAKYRGIPVHNLAHSEMRALYEGMLRA